MRPVVDLDNPSFWKGFRGTVELGMEHIFIGTDHILFVLALFDTGLVGARCAQQLDPRTLDVGAGSGWPSLYLVRETGCEAALVDLPLEGLRRADL